VDKHIRVMSLGAAWSAAIRTAIVWTIGHMADGEVTEVWAGTGLVARGSAADLRLPSTCGRGRQVHA
jgi:hypothetical protein